jgi:hypothetical protein
MFAHSSEIVTFNGTCTDATNKLLISVIDEIIGTKLTIEIVTAHWTNN